MVINRLLKRRTKSFLTDEEKHRVVKAIQEAEHQTSGEVRVHIESHCKEPPYERAKKVFEKLQMHKTKLKNATLVYVAVDDRKFAILGDSGIHALVPSDFWHDIRDVMQAHFKRGEFCTGICLAVREIGLQLKKFFPHQKDDINELSDDISFGD